VLDCSACPVCLWLLRYWDLRQQNPAHTQALPERAYAMSVRHPLLVVGTAERHIVVYNLAAPQVGRIPPNLAPPQQMAETASGHLAAVRLVARQYSQVIPRFFPSAVACKSL